MARRASQIGAGTKQKVRDISMDGMTDIAIGALATQQQTLKTAISCVGVGLHGGQRVHLSLQPAPADTGIVFRRTDLGIDIPASARLVTDTRLCTQITHPDHPQAYVRTVEHVMAALAGLGIDNAIVALDGPEVPVLDGSSAPFVFLIDCAGRETQSAARQVIEILRPVRVSLGEATAELRPGAACLDLSMSIDFEAAAIGRQALSLSLTEQGFRHTLASARTFAMLAEIEALQASGLARGGSLDNAVVVDGARVLNPGGLRARDEFVRHKMLDAVGDLAMAGAPIHGRFVANRTGHALNNRLVRALLADERAWRLVSLEQDGWSQSSYERGARAA
jgi:UDP-3-O-[3-hydroxymyristoyl] N-acetylglucosamine deacetylase